MALDVRAVEAIPGRWHGLVVYVNDETYPENGVFWTRARNRGDIVVLPGGASEIVLTLHVGPIRGRVLATAGNRTLDTDMGPNETRTVSVAVPPGREAVPISVQAPDYFRPAQVEAASTDMRALGCQVRIGLQ